ncbi:hypothetical protein ACFPC0_11150 [Streptomyces andamanensis]|uniref:Uncharacterized protein n=1 Tax=Streptomyces andamanensis TaxID=1565035 RepID=A0ABV8TCZ8_9ACTN
MLKAYVRRYDGSTYPVTIRQHGQHIGATQGKVRFARLWWQDTLPKDDGEEASRALLTDSAVLVDRLVLTRVGAHGEERQVFQGLLTEVTVDTGEQISVAAVDNPNTDQIYPQLVEQPFSVDGPLLPSDQVSLAVVPKGAPPQPPEARGLFSAGLQPSGPAARPVGPPAAPPAGLWQQQPGHAPGVPATTDV